MLTTTAPADPDCLILLFTTEAPVILYCRVGDENWRDYNYAQSIAIQKGIEHRQDYYLISPVRFNGKIYATSSYADLVHINIDESYNCTTSLIHNSVRKYPSGPFRIGTSLVACGDQALCFVYIDGDPAYDYLSGGIDDAEPQEIGIYKFRFSTNSWEEMTSLNRRAIFFGHFYSLSCPVVDDDSNKEWSYIYFASTKDLTLYEYRVEDERRTSYLPCPFSPIIPRDASLDFSWIMPAKDIRGDQPALNHDTQQQCKQSVQRCRSGMAPENGSGKADVQRCRSVRALENGSGKAWKDGQPLLLDLPQEVLCLIAGNLSFVDFLNFVCVNNACARTIAQTRRKPFPPSLIYVDKVNGVYKYTILDSDLNHKVPSELPEVLKGYTIRCSKDGWLLMEYLRDIAFFNPFTKKVIPVDPTPSDVRYLYNFTFLSKPYCSDCSIIGLSQFKEAESFSRGIFSYSEKIWWKTILDYVESPKLNDGYNSPAFLEGSFYYLGNDGRLGHLQPNEGSDPEFKWLSQLRVPCTNYQQSFLTECGGDLVSIFVGRTGKRSWIRLFKLKLKEEDWKEINTLGSYSLYLSRASSIARIAESPDMANRIYFARFYKDGLVYYSLNTKKYHSLGSPDTREDFYKTSMYWNCAWIEARWW